MPGDVNAPANVAEHRRWNDERWTAAWPRRERLTRAVTPFVLEVAALGPRERVLDVGCGGGVLAIEAARKVGAEGAVIGADLSAQLVALAGRRASEAGLANLEFRVIDVQTDPIDSAPFDAALSQFGVMFFDEPVRAFANVRAHLKPGGRLVFACWEGNDKNPWFWGHAIADLVEPPPEPPPGKTMPSPFSLADVEQTTTTLHRAGFTGVRHSAHALTVDVPFDALYDDSQLVLMGVPPDELARARSTVGAYLSRFALADGLMRVGLAFQLFAASNPQA